MWKKGTKRLTSKTERFRRMSSCRERPMLIEQLRRENAELKRKLAFMGDVPELRQDAYEAGAPRQTFQQQGYGAALQTGGNGYDGEYDDVNQHGKRSKMDMISGEGRP
jgi:hypothetical protein